MKNKNKSKMITAYQRMVDRMKLMALGLKHHWWDNKCLSKFKECITKNGMTQELVLPNYHCFNIAKQAIQMLKTILSPSPVELAIGFPSPCGAISCDQQNLPSIYYNWATLHQKCPHMPMSMGNKTTWNARLYPWDVWWWPTTSPKTNKPGTSMWTLASTLGWQWSITDASTSTLWKQGRWELAIQYF